MEKYDKGLKNLNIIFNSNQNHLRYFLLFPPDA